MKRHKDYLFVTTLTSLDAISDLANSAAVAYATVEARKTVVGAAVRNATAAPANTKDPNMAKKIFIVGRRDQVDQLMIMIGLNQ